MPTKVKAKKIKRKPRSQVNVEPSRTDGRARKHTHPSQLPQPNATRRQKTIAVRAPDAIIAAINTLADDAKMSRNEYLLSLMREVIGGKKRS